MTPALPLPGALADIWVYLSATPLLGLTLTLLTYHGAYLLYQRSGFNPLANPARSKERRDWILGRMYKLGKITEADYTAAINEPLNASYHVPTPEVNAPYIAEMARAEMVGRYGSDAYTEGFRVTTTVPSNLQEMANTALHEGLMTYDQRHGYRGPESRLPGKTREAWAAELGESVSAGFAASPLASICCWTAATLIWW